MNFAVGICVFFFGAISLAAEPPSVRDRVFTFLEKNMMGRTQQTALEGTLESDGQKYQVKFSATIKWDKLEKTEEGIIFEETRDIKQTSTKVGGTGGAADVYNTDRVVVHRYSLSERETAKALGGYAAVTKDTLEDPTGKAFETMVDLSPDNKELYVYQSLVGFAERSLDGKTVIPVADAASATYFLDSKGKLQTNETLKFYKVDVNKDFARQEIHRFNVNAAEVN